MMDAINSTLLRVSMAFGDLRARLTEERGQDLIEYALLGGFIAVAFAAAALFLPLDDAFTDMVTAIGNCVDFNDACP